MAGTARPAPAGERAMPRGHEHASPVVAVLSAVSVALVAAQFALAGFGAFAMDKTPADNDYGPHIVLGLVIAAMTLVILGAVLASRPTRGNPRVLWPAVALAVLAVPVQPLLGDSGQSVPAVGALHVLNGLVIFALVCWLTWETTRGRLPGQR
jgi:hypothetical protein